ncbi:serine/threonine-protein kinase [Sorangium sp. So ce1151]|uniref:serine/threonine-protein kinase n=1 Tax=Sorangium sp. So ce1151 TaxID=3133332 RepID=UPI003F5DC919
MNTTGRGQGARGGEFAGTSRFRVLNRLGYGSLGHVYRVEDTETGQEVALKTLPELDAEGIYYIKQEFRSLRGIRNGNLVELYELFVDGDHCFFTMELIDGLPFTSYIWALGGRPSTAAGLSSTALVALRRALRQLARGVASLHRRCKLHRDIKPDNILVTREGRVVLLDFDLVTHLQSEGSLDVDFDLEAGTRAYMSPEQHWGKALTHAADWYSVGVLIFETLSGELPFDGPLERMIPAKESLALPSLRVVAPGTPDDLEALVRALLHPRPEQRAGEAEILDSAREANRPSSYIPLGQRRASTSARFIGRDVEIAALQSIFDCSATDGPTLVRIEGTSGIGKTELVESFLSSVLKRSLILRGACHHQESVPYKSFDSLVDNLSRYLSLLERDGKPVPTPRDVSALTRVFPVLGRIQAFLVSDDLDNTPPQELRRLAFRALRDLLIQLANARPLILWIDDLQWGDADSAPLFRELLRPPDAPRLVLIVSYRSEDRTSNVLLRSIESLQEANDVRVHTISVGPLSAVDSRTLAEELVAEVPEAPPVDELVQKAAGSPFFLVELARYAATGLEGQTPSSAGGDRLHRMLRHRIGLLNASERSILDVVCIASKQMDRSLLLQAAGLGERGRRELSRLSEEHLVRLIELNGRLAIEISHDLFRQAVLSDLESDRRRWLHRRVAEVLRSGTSPDPEALLFHYREAGEEPTARKYAWAAAERATATLAFDRAAELYQWLLSTHDQDIERWRIQEKLGGALANAGRARQAAESFEAAAEELEKAATPTDSVMPTVARKLRRQAAEQYLRGGDVEQGVDAARQALRAVGLEYPASAWRAWVTTLVQRARLTFRGLGHTQRNAEQIRDVDLDRIDACWSVGIGLTWIDRTRTAAFQARGTLLALEAGEPTRVAEALAAEASMLASFGGASRRRRSEVVLADARRLVNESDDLWLKAFLVLIEGSIAFYDARWKQAHFQCRRAEDMFRKRARAAAWEMTSSQLLSLGALAYLGDVAELRRTLPVLVDDAETRGDLLSASCLASGLPNLLWLCLDQPDEARRRAEKAIKGWKQDDFQFPHYLHLLASTQIDIYLGNGQDAWRRMLRVWPRVLASFLPIVENLRITLHHLRARAALAAAAGEPEASGRAYRRELLLRIAEWDTSRLEREEAEWAAPLSVALRAGLATARGRHAEACRSLELAAQLFSSMDMGLYAAAARFQQGAVEQGAAGQAARRTGQASMQEHHVINPARLAATLVPLVKTI